MPTDKMTVVFVHGWSVTNTDTYGGLPARLRAEAAARGMNLQVADIYLGRYISFHDEVRVRDISRAFRTAVQDQLPGLLRDGARFICVTHSTGGPVIRDWWNRYYVSDRSNGICPMSHLVMLAPANYGSALAQLGKGRIGRLKSWLGGIEPGQGVLDWLELGSEEAWDLNSQWILSDGGPMGPQGVFPFVLTGQSIDRAFYDNLNSYTGELGSDGVVRVAAANLCGTYIQLAQGAPGSGPDHKADFSSHELIVKKVKGAPETALRIISGKSHSGEKMGIMRSVREDSKDENSRETVDAILACIQVRTHEQYKALCDRFLAESEAVQEKERLEVESEIFLSPTYFFHDKFSMVIFRVRDNEDNPVTDYDLILTAGPEADPNHLPRGFFVDRQRNRVNTETITYFINNDAMKGTGAVKDKGGKVVRESMKGAGMLGFKIVARPDKGFVHYFPCELKAAQDVLQKALQPNSTTLIDIRLQRVVHKNVFRVGGPQSSPKPVDFKDTPPGEEVVE